ncbi:transcription factor-like protein [Corchorus olitorius]|uniref:Transcription factor-like protein n=1 Tax=Corchorus olitorius TaxID=93759 RepID=A0A1R3K534_9ROSI|nr:transcription factor-like protein [Corchorus olitorius]
MKKLLEKDELVGVASGVVDEKVFLLMNKLLEKEAVVWERSNKTRNGRGRGEGELRMGVESGWRMNVELGWRRDGVLFGDEGLFGGVFLGNNVRMTLVSVLGKRSRDVDMDQAGEFILNQGKRLKSELKAQISNWVYEYYPGMWDVLQVGPVVDYDLLSELFGHKEGEIESNIIECWERSAKGKSKGNRRFFQIKKAARNKVRMERRRQMIEISELLKPGQTYAQALKPKADRAN